MKRKRKGCAAVVMPILCAALLTAVLSCASASVREIGEPDNGSTINTHRGDTIRLRLPARLSTGYGWTLCSAKNVKSFGEPQIETPGAKITGGLDFQIFTFEVPESGEGKIALVYARPWEKGVKPIKVYRVRILAK